MTLDQSKQSVSSFISQLEKEDIAEKNAAAIRNTPSRKLNKIEQKKEEAKELTTADIFAKIYKDALPLEDSYKVTCSGVLDNGVATFIKSKCNAVSPYQYISEKAGAGSVSAGNMLDAVNESVDQYFRKFYESVNDPDQDIDDIDLPEPDRNSIVDKISDDMGYDQVSEIIKNHVKETVQDEIKKTKEEDEHMKELEDNLAADETLTTESAIEAKLSELGETNKGVYKPSLFTGIMINKTDLYTEEAGLDESHIEKKAFFESVKEYTLWDMMHTLGFENYSKSDIDFIATKYARGTI